MSLFCPSTLIVARHGQAQYPQAVDLLSDHGGWLTATGRQQAEQLGRSLAHRRIAAIYTSVLERARETGQIVADSLQVPAHELPGLHEFSVGDLAGQRVDDVRLTGTFAGWLAGDVSARIPGGESGREVLARFGEALASIADQHRGETVLVISHGGVMCFGLPRLAYGSIPSPTPALANCATVEVAAGDDGWTLGAWPDPVPD